jgi:mevalonate kinase
MGTGTGFGKTIFIGDQFVLYEVPAIVSSLPFETVARVEKITGHGWILADNRKEVPGYKEKKKDQQLESINKILEVLKIDTARYPIKITFEGDLLAGSGVGASAASCVSLARALNNEFGLGLPIEEINNVGWQGEFAYHGIPSGVDNTASTYGGLLFYYIKNNEKIFEKIQLKEPIDVVLGNSGITANTAALDGLIKTSQDNDPQLFDKRLKVITEQVYNMRNCLENADLEGAGRIMSDNHRILIDMGLSHERLIHLCDLAIEKGALGGKLTGGGMGGYMVALTPGKSLQEKVASAMEKEGFAVIKATVGG